MQFNIYNDINKFVEENLDLLLSKEWVNNLMVANCLEGMKLDTVDWFLATIVDNNKTELIMLYRKPWKLLMYSPTNNKSEELYSFAAEEIYKIDKELIGVNTEKDIANKFAEYYCNISCKESELSMKMRILLLEELNKGELLEGVKFRKAVREDKEILIQYIKEFNREIFEKELSFAECEEKFNLYMNNGYYVLEKDGMIVSQVVISRVLKSGKCISGVYTPKELRGKGYAYNCVYKASEDCLKNGAGYCVLYADDFNPISNRVYEKIGYKRVAEQEDISFI